jgi:hypothetical protein
LLADLVHRKVPIVGGTVGGGRGSVGIWVWGWQR